MPWLFSKTDRSLITILDEPGTKIEQPMYQHLSNCCAFNDHIMLFTLLDAATNTTIVKTLAPEINFGLKASKELQLFK